MDEFAGPPPRQGLYDPSYEKDACGIGLIVSIPGTKSHSNVQDALEILDNLKHRGAQGADAGTGDGCGILTQVPDRLFRSLNLPLPEAGHYAVGMVFLPPEESESEVFKAEIAAVLHNENLKLLGWRKVPVDNSSIGKFARKTEPSIWQFFVSSSEELANGLELDRKLYVARRLIENRVSSKDIAGKSYFSIPSFSTQTIVYKGLMLPEQLSAYYLDLGNELYESAIAMVHSRFSTNTFPTWPLAHPYRYLCHNGEINTLKGNLNWMKAREGNVGEKIFGKATSELTPIISPKQSDSACLDNMLEFLVLGGRSLAHAMMMLIPEPWSGNSAMDLERRGFYEYHASMMEPWDGPAAVCFTDGRWVGATLDRNGLRPCRYFITEDQRVILSSEVGVLPLDSKKVIQRGRLEPGKMFLVDTLCGRVVDDGEIKATMASQKPYRDWVLQNRLTLEDLPELEDGHLSGPTEALREKQKVFGYTEEELRMVLYPMAVNGEEALSSMGTDTPLAALSQRPQLLFNYMKQLFAQVTNPPIDPIRELLVMSLVTYIGPKSNVLIESAESCKRIRIQQPILSNIQLEKIRAIPDIHFKSKTLHCVFNALQGAEALEPALEQLCLKAEEAVDDGVRFLILSDRKVSAESAPIPSLLSLSAVHQHLVRKGKRTLTGLLVETGEARDVHHFACLIGFGAGAINPYLAFDTLDEMAHSGRFPEAVDSATANDKFVKAVGKGLLKIFSKMGISTIQSYCGAQLFESLGLSPLLVDKYFTGTPTRLSGVDLKNIASDTLERHENAYRRRSLEIQNQLSPGGEIHYRVQGEHHEWNPKTISLLQRSSRENDAKTYKEFSDAANARDREPTMLRDCLEIEFKNTPIALEEVEPASEIVKRFTTGAMSLGAISKEAHETLAVAMNRIGAKSNTGEGGEDPQRFQTRENGDSANSAIKQIASARFGVTTHYLTNAKEIQIKMAQGAKPGEGGQLPGHKVDEAIAALRYSTPGVTLISPPPHHDIYSIEDLAQLIFDLKNVNPDGDISVKLVSEVGVGTVAAGVAKARADKILISGDSGGTGASPLSSIKHAGIPWEIGLSETHQTLVLNGLRSRVRIETDGQLKTGRDVVIAALLGAEEFGFATAPLIVEGCIMMRKCHLNTCPVGIATQDPVLRKNFAGRPEHVINYLFFVAEEVRSWMASMGLRKFEELVGRTDFLKQRVLPDHMKASRLDLSALLHRPSAEADKNRNTLKQDHRLTDVLDHTLIEKTQSAWKENLKCSVDLPISNFNRSTGAMLSGHVTRLARLQEDLISVKFTGSAGQSFGAFLCEGIRFELRGESNDYVGKGLSGGKIIVYPDTPTQTPSIIIGNTGLYGATSGSAFIAGMAGERFAVRNSGATAVTEGVGDHGCEYMTGGLVVILGKTGRNFAAGMSGGIAYVLDEDSGFSQRCNKSLVELEALNASEELKLFELIQLHVQLTKSGRAEFILKNRDSYLKKFIKVIPFDYKRALQKRNELKVSYV